MAPKPDIQQILDSFDPSSESFQDDVKQISSNPISRLQPKEIDPDVLMEFIETGVTKKAMAEELDVSIYALNKKIQELQDQSPVLLQYRTLQSLELTKLQSKVLDNITDEKIESASLRDLVLAYRILKDKEQVIEGKPSDIKGLVSYLIEMEREEAGLNQKPLSKEHIIDISRNGMEPDERLEDESPLLSSLLAKSGIKLGDIPE